MLYPAHTSVDDFAAAYEAIVPDDRPDYVSILVGTPQGEQHLTLNGHAVNAVEWATKVEERGRTVVMRLHEERIPYVSDALCKAFILGQIPDHDLRIMESWGIQKDGPGRAIITHNGVRIGAISLRSCTREMRSSGIPGERWSYTAEGVQGPRYVDQVEGAPGAFGPEVSMGGTSAALPFEPFTDAEAAHRTTNLRVIERGI